MSIVVIGNFDGVHKGHQQILNRAKALAGDEKIIALTFDPHPVSVFAPERAPSLLTILSDKIELLKIHNADQVAVIKFTKEFAAMAPEDFVNKVLVEQLKASTVIVGHGRAHRPHRHELSGQARPARCPFSHRRGQVALRARAASFAGLVRNDATPLERRPGATGAGGGR